ncbi:MAG: S41 family peptidase [bacterium]|nr:S41 family peptidase [bacterium]
MNGNIGYVNLGLLKPKQTRKCLRELKDTRAIIFDVRNYPNGTMYRIAKFTYPNLFFPGVYYFTKPYYCGKKKKHPYAGKVVLLFNETTQSHAEFALMGLQTAPNVISIGSETAGADGNVSSVVFPGNYKTKMTGIGVYYPGGRETQRIGIIPDIEVKPTLEGIKLHKDEVLEKALQIINKK